MLKQDGKTLRLVHNLQPLNAVTIWDSSVPPFIEHLAESFGGYTVYGMMDLFARYDQRSSHMDSWDMTTFNSLLGPHHLTTLPMGHTNTVQIYQADMAFILQDEIPHHTMLFIDDLPVKSETSWYQRPDGLYETIPENPGIRLFTVSGNISPSSTESSNASKTLMQPFQLRNSSLLLRTPPLLVTSAPPKVGFHMRLKSRRSGIGQSARI